MGNTKKASAVASSEREERKEFFEKEEPWERKSFI